MKMHRVLLAARVRRRCSVMTARRRRRRPRPSAPTTPPPTARRRRRRRRRRRPCRPSGMSRRPGPATAGRWRCGSARAATPRWSTPSSRPGTQVNPDRQINLTYIPHAEMVPKLAQAIASGDVPDLMGLDLIYGPQFASAGQLEDITDLIGDDPTAARRSPRATAPWPPGTIGSTACRSTPTSRCCSGTRSCSTRPGSTPS